VTVSHTFFFSFCRSVQLTISLRIDTPMIMKFGATSSNDTVLLWFWFVSGIMMMMTTTTPKICRQGGRFTAYAFTISNRNSNIVRQGPNYSSSIQRPFQQPKTSSRRCSSSSAGTSIGGTSQQATVTTADDAVTKNNAAVEGDGNTRLFSEELNVLYDSKCNVCRLEIDWLARRDERLNNPRPKLKMTDLESPDYDPNDKSNGGIDYETGMAAIYDIKPDGTVLRGIPVFQVAYEQVGLGWLWKISQVPAARKVLDVGYELFAKYRTRITRGSSLDELVRLHEDKKNNMDCESCQTK
jgi:predicted DCC family thiol-disulfide oxidoreductase YuxK